MDLMPRALPRSAAAWLRIAGGARALLLGAATCCLTPATAATSLPANLSVSMTITGTCTFSTLNMVFGNYVGAATSTTANITVTCPSTTGYSITIDGGAHSLTNPSTRNMAGPGGVLVTYDIYRDTGRTQHWGNTAGTDDVIGTGNGAAQTITAYGGGIAANQYVTPGAYSDTVTVTLHY